MGSNPIESCNCKTEYAINNGMTPVTNFDTNFGDTNFGFIM